MKSPTNADRAMWGDIAVEAFEIAVAGDREDTLSDLLADLMHWADREGFEFNAELGRARGNYAAEVEEEAV